MSYYIIIRGPLGCGKSTISGILAEKLGAEKISIDRIVDDPELVKKEKEEGYISQNSFKEANAIAVSWVEDKIKKGTPIIFDGNFYWESQIKDLIERFPYEHYVFTLKASLETCIERDKGRDKTHGEMAAKVVYKKSTSFSYGDEIDTEGKTEGEVVNEIMERLR